VARRDDVLLIGLGRFGRALAETMVSLGHEVMGIDSDERVVQASTGRLTHVVQADATDTDTMRQLGAGAFETAVVAIGTDIESSILACYVLVDLGVNRIWAKAITESHGAILSRVGATRVIFPERDMGVRVAHTLTGRTIDYVELDPGFVLIETTVPRWMVGKTLEACQLRTRHQVTVVCTKPEGGVFTYATADTVVHEGDLIVIAGEKEPAEAFATME
jgi:trk system potassium uptake protein TrkA